VTPFRGRKVEGQGHQAEYLWNGKAYELRGTRMEYDHPRHWRVRWPQRSKVKVIESHDWCMLARFAHNRPLNAVSENHRYLRIVKAYKLQTWNTDAVRWAGSPTCAVTSKDTGQRQRHNVTSSLWRVFAHNSTKRSHWSTKIGRKVCPCHAWHCKVLKSKVNVTRPLWVAVQVKAYCGGRTTGRTACCLLTH